MTRHVSAGRSASGYLRQPLPQVEGRVAVVEAKFGAHLTDGQVSAYLEVFSRRSGPHTGALFVLVPPSRVVEAQRVLKRAITARSDTTPAHAVVTWDEWLKVWTAVAEETSDAALPATSAS
jgi:hypothetical protein